MKNEERKHDDYEFYIDCLKKKLEIFSSKERRKPFAFLFDSVTEADFMGFCIANDVDPYALLNMIIFEFVNFGRVRRADDPVSIKLVEMRIQKQPSR